MNILKYLFFVLFASFSTFAQSKETFYTKQELIKFPIEAAYYLNKKDDYSLSKFLNNQMGMRLDNNSVNNYSIFTQTLDGSYDYDQTVTFYSLVVDKRSTDQVIHSWYLKTRGNGAVVNKSFYDYLDSHPKAVRMEKGLALVIGGINKQNLSSQKVIIGIIPDYLSNALQYTVFFIKNDNSLTLAEILREIYY